MPFARPYELALLRAALAEGPDAAEAAQGWLAYHRDGSGFGGLESGSRRLLPLVYKNVKAFIPPNYEPNCVGFNSNPGPTTRSASTC